MAIRPLQTLLLASLLILSFDLKAQEVGHEHNLFNELFGDGEGQFVCYNRVHRNFYLAIFFSVAGLAVVGFSRYHIKKKAARELEKKNNIIAEKNKDILDSINYAKRIQSAILPANDLVEKLLPDHFVLYKPKDIVSGDFYWIGENGSKVLIAAVDCTGHGVPGALLSMIGHNALNKVVNQDGLTKPAEILAAMHREVVATLGQDGRTDLKDGMDVSLCAYHKATGMLEFAGAYNPVFIVRKNNSLEELKGDRHAIASAGAAEKGFTNHQVQLEKGDAFYLLSDGLSDQFGGKDGKKFKVSRFKGLLTSVHGHPMSEQRRVIERAIEEWRGSLEQIDDIMVIGVRI